MTLSIVNVVVWGQGKSENTCSWLPVTMHLSKMCLLKLPIVTLIHVTKGDLG